MTEIKKIYFDMDGTIADFYGVDGWLDYLTEYDPYPYENAKPMFNFSAFARQIHRLQESGYQIGIISWLSKTGTTEFNANVIEVKQRWLKRHLPSVEFNEIHIIEYGTPKSLFGDGILFDDEERNREEWSGLAYDVENILEILRNL